VTPNPDLESATDVAGEAAVASTAAFRVRGALQPARIVDPRGRSKILRPLPVAEREAALARGLTAYARGDFYLAHEELEPAWMGSADSGERELLAGLIKVAAAFVHASRGNPAGAATNLRGARARLAGAAAAGRDCGFDVPALLVAIDDRLARLGAEPATPEHALRERPVPDPPHDVAGPAGRARRRPLALEPLVIARRTRA
jgi:predicted metal-dependent hydrolase